MIKLGKLTDYGVVLMVHMARHEETLFNATQLSDQLGLSRQTVAKCLKSMAHHGLLTSRRGVHGGYVLARDGKDISVADVVSALEGPISITECVGQTVNKCCIEGKCPLRGGWNEINTAIEGALKNVSIAQMAEKR